MSEFVDGLIEQLGIEVVSESAERVEAVMPITSRVKQPYGFVHGGATLALLETVASIGVGHMANLEVERPFGIHMDARHFKAGVSGSVRGVAELDRVEGNKQFWRIAAYDDAGDVMTAGTFMTKIVSLERLAEKGVAAAPMPMAQAPRLAPEEA